MFFSRIDKKKLFVLFKFIVFLINIYCHWNISVVRWKPAFNAKNRKIWELHLTVIKWSTKYTALYMSEQIQNQLIYQFFFKNNLQIIKIIKPVFTTFWLLNFCHQQWNLSLFNIEELLWCSSVWKILWKRLMTEMFGKRIMLFINLSTLSNKRTNSIFRKKNVDKKFILEAQYFIIPPLHRRGVYCFISVLPFVPRYFSSHFSQQLLMAEIWYLVTSFIYRRYAILWEAFLDPSDSYFLFTDLVGFYTHWRYMWGYHKWTLAHSSSCWKLLIQIWLKSDKNWPRDNFLEICDFR